ncbi:MAG: class I SAM-dependent methyltransferase [Afipia sp.]
MARNVKKFAKAVCPPILWNGLAAVRRNALVQKVSAPGDGQDLDLYWDADMADLLEKWGEGTTWTEIQLLMSARSGRILDIACGTGVVMKRLGQFSNLEIHGCDISDALISRAVNAGILTERLTVCDATQMPYTDRQFDFSYSIGSFEHFTIDGIKSVIAEAARTTGVASFHMVPTSRSGEDEGWMKTYQSFHNCSVRWWTDHFGKSFHQVHVLDSRWEDRISVGKWFVCCH